MRIAYLSLTAAIAFAAMAPVSATAGEPAAEQTTSSAIADAVAAPDRPEDARKLDESRKPAEVLTFLGLEEGMAATDVMTGSGYWAEIMGHAVGSTGSVIALEPTQFYNEEKQGADWQNLQSRAPAVALKTYSFEAFSYPADSFDFAIINLSYHDIYWESVKYNIPKSDPDKFTNGLYAAMKPGGIVGVIDHVGEGDDTRALVDKMHRIDPAVVRADFERAGFVLEAESDLLANPDDDHTKGVFDASIRGKTDRFLMKFRKPR